MKKMWAEPRVQVQEFIPNEYVAACFKLACRRGSEGNSYPDDFWYGGERGGDSHSPIGTPDTCGDANANRVITSEGGTFQSVGEFNGEQGWLNGKMTHWIDKGQPGVIDPGDIIFWYTESGFGSNKRKWNHWGYVEQQDSSHPNHS